MRGPLIGTTLLLLLVTIACSDPVPLAEPSPSPSPTAIPTSTVTPTPEPTPSPVPTPTPVLKLSPSEIFERISPSIAHLRTETSRGTGVLIDDGYIITNAHVVWPFETVDVTFPDGTTFNNARVANWDLLIDLALIGPVSTSIQPLALADGEYLPIGSEVYLIGYPGEAETRPDATITRGIISRIREWESAEVSFFQTDVSIAGGQSGGALVSEKGEFIAISGLRFTEAGFGLAASASDISERVTALSRGHDVSGVGRRSVALEGGNLRHIGTLRGFGDQQAYVIKEQEGTNVEISAESENDLFFIVYDQGGNKRLVSNNFRTGRESGSFKTTHDGPHYLLVGQQNHSVAEYTVESNRNLIPIDDEDDWQSIDPYRCFCIVGSLDFPHDSDVIVKNMLGGFAYQIYAESLTDIALQVTFPDVID